MNEELARFGELYQRFMETVTEAAGAQRVSPIRELLRRHLETDPSNVPVVADTFAPYDHVNVQVAVSAYLESEGRRHDLVGVTGQQRHFESLADLLHASRYGVELGSVDYVNLPVSPDETLACVQFGLFLVEDRGARLAALMRGASEYGPQQAVTLEVLCPQADRARAFLGEVRRLMVERNVFRRQMISFGEPHMGYVGVGPVVFHRRPQVRRDDLVLPRRVLDLLDRQVFGIVEHRDRLRRSGQHVKRGLLLYGPPGNGKTLSVKYVVSRATDHTVLLLTGGALHLLRPAVALARMLEPSIVVLEDVDLVARERGGYPGHGSNPVLFDLLNQMDGMPDDADVVFLLTTNRADALEPALAARPGRVDLALELGLPDEEARRRLIALYARGVDLRVADLDRTVSRTAGVAASFIKELMRKAALLGAERSDGAGPVAVTDRELEAALQELLDEGSAMTRTLLGGDPARLPRPGTEWLHPEGRSPT